MSYPNLTGPALVARINELGAACIRETRAAYAKGAGREDAGVYGRTPLMDRLRAEIGLSDPVVPSAREHGELSRRLYTAHVLGTASATAVGG